MNEKRLPRLLRGYFKTYGRAMALCVTIPLLFAVMHLLGGGALRELNYSLLLIAFVLTIAAVSAFVRYARLQLRLWDALENLPPDANAIPSCERPIDADYRALALAYQRQRETDAAQALADERARVDYYTLWIHQVKTPIAALDLMAQSGEAVDRALLRQEVFKIEQYAEAALSYQRLQSLHGDLELRDTPLYPLCATTVKKLRPLFLYRRISLDMPPFDDSALTDAKWLGLVLSQVLTNSLKYTSEGGSISIRLAKPQVLTIADTGVGIASEDLPRVFERGFTGQIGRECDKSTGIGLYLCKEICDKLGHRIALASQKGVGTTVTIDLRRERFEAF